MTTTPSQIAAEAIEGVTDARFAPAFAITELGAELDTDLMSAFGAHGIVFAPPATPFCRHEWSEVVGLNGEAGTVYVHESGRVLDGTAEVAEEAMAIRSRDDAELRADMVDCGRES